MADPNFVLFSIMRRIGRWPVRTQTPVTDIKEAPEKKGPDNPCTGQNDTHEAGELAEFARVF